ncbi:hypothetical protein [Yinghuangia sp. YIM S09857]|uniref:hypothetical protein n=1 Tax=Yinghuangia sp. YIM S09857 TaxID=3436929 RepID=UPI003F5297C2
MNRPAVHRSRRTSRAIALVLGATCAFTLVGCGGKKKETDFDKFVARHLCEKLVRGGDGDIDMSCVDPGTGKRVDIEFEANDRPGQYFTDTAFGGTVHVFSQKEVRDAKVYSKIKKS